MKTAIPFTVSVALFCPYCDETIVNKNPCKISGSRYRFEVNDKVPAILTCDSCGKKSKPPKKCGSRSIYIELNGEVKTC